MDLANEPMIMTDVDQQTFNNSDTCYICIELFVEHRYGLVNPSLNKERKSGTIVTIQVNSEEQHIMNATFS